MTSANGFLLPQAPKPSNNTLDEVQVVKKYPIKQVAANPAQITHRIIKNRAQFETLSKRENVPGAMGVREVKFLIGPLEDTEPSLYFMDSNRFEYHVDFANAALQLNLTNYDFTRLTYFTKNRKYLAGSVVAYDHFTAPNQNEGLYAIEFWPTDPVNASHVALAYRLISQNMPFAHQQLAYHPASEMQMDNFALEAEEFAKQSVEVVSTNDIFESTFYSPLNLGVAHGLLRVVSADDNRPVSARDIAIFTALPNDLPRVAGVISLDPQTPLSHVNLRAMQNKTPNVYIDDALTHPEIAPYIGQWVKFEVKPDGISTTPISREQALGIHASLRPKAVQTPKRNLTKTNITPLDQLSESDFDSFGTKAANLGVLRNILPPEIVPDGFAVPFYFYTQFLQANGLETFIQKTLNKDSFKTDENKRVKALKSLRKKIKKAPMPAELRTALGHMHKQFPTGTTPRCRSSANAEDMPGFNAAGLYNSYTHRADEGHIEKSIKQVWASLWTHRAFEEREFYRINHEKAAMGVLVHPNFDDELVNGVALTRNIYFPTIKGYYINSQLGEALVTNPAPSDVAEELLVMQDINTDGRTSFENIRLRRSNMVALGETVLKDAHLNILITHLQTIHDYFQKAYGEEKNEAFAMDVEFKVDRHNKLFIKQARPWINPSA